MAHKENHFYAIKKDGGNIVFIDDVPNGKKCGCICSKCKEPLVAKNGGEIKEHHFAHLSNSYCRGETLAHPKAKEIISEKDAIWHIEWRKIDHEFSLDSLVGGH